MTNAFQTRHNVNLTNKELRDSVRDVLNQIYGNNQAKKKHMNTIFPHCVKLPLGEKKMPCPLAKSRHA